MPPIFEKTKRDCLKFENSDSLFFLLLLLLLFYKYKIYGKYKEYECHNVVPCKCFAFEAEGNNHSEYNAGNSLLYNLQLHK